MGLFKKLFHQCVDHLEYIEGTRFPGTGIACRGKVWRNYRCSVCGKLYTSSGNGLYRIKLPYASPIKKCI